MPTGRIEPNGGIGRRAVHRPKTLAGWVLRDDSRARFASSGYCRLSTGNAVNGVLGVTQASIPSKVAAAIASSRSEEHTSELQSLMRISYAVFCLKKKNTQHKIKAYT